MQREFDFGLSEKQINEAEGQRARGYVFHAMVATSPVVEFRIERFGELAVDGQQRLLKTARINVVAGLSWAKESERGPTVASRLEQTRGVIVNIYRNDDVQRIAPEIRLKDYDFVAEMLRDEADYLLTLAALSGNNTYILAAIEKLDKANKSFEAVTSAAAVFEKARQIHRSGRAKENYTDLGDAFDQAINASQTVGNWERVSTISARFTVESVKSGHLGNALTGLLYFAKAAMHDHSTKGILFRETGKALVEKRKHASWRKTTPTNFDYSSLDLPE